MLFAPLTCTTGAFFKGFFSVVRLLLGFCAGEAPRVPGVPGRQRHGSVRPAERVQNHGTRGAAGQHGGRRTDLTSRGSP